MEAEDHELFQHKPRKRTEQKKSKSAEFLMVKDIRSGAEGIENPSFNISARNLSAYHNSAEKEIRRDRHDSTLAAHQQKLLLRIYDQARGPDRVDDMDFYLKPLKHPESEILDERETETTGACMRCESTGVCKNILGLRQEVEREMIPPYVEHFEASVQDDMILVGSLSLEQAQDQRRRFPEARMHCWSHEEHLVEQQKLSVKTPEEDAKKRVMTFVRDKTKGVKLQGINSKQSECPQASLRAAFQNSENELVKALERRRGEVVTLYGDLTEVRHHCSGVQGLRRWKVEWAGTPQSIQIQLKCLRGVKNKLPNGKYIVKVSLHSRLGVFPLRWSNLKGQDSAGTTQPVYHDGNFYDVELNFNQSLAVVLPSVNDVKPGMALIFELFLLHGINSSIDQVVAWGAFPICDGKLKILEGKYKCPLLRGHQDVKIDEFRKIEDIISSDIDHWLCNLYFQMIKLPKSLVGHETRAVELQLPPQLLSPPQCSYTSGKTGTAENPVENIPPLKVAWIQQTDCGYHHLKPKCSRPSVPAEDHRTCGSRPESAEKFDERIRTNSKNKVFLKGSRRNVAEFDRKDKCQSPAEESTSPAEPECLEDLAQYRFSVVSEYSPDRTMNTLAWQVQFVSQMFLDQLRASHWCSSETWFFVLLVALIWFVRLYLHYFSQWIYLQAIGVTVYKFNFYPHTVELNYQSSLLETQAELTVVALGPLTLNATLLIMSVIRWVCQVQFGSIPSFLSRFIMAMGFWTVLDPLAIFIVDGILGHLAYSTEHPIGDAAKLYWLFHRTQHSGIPGILITVILYIVIFLCSLTILYLQLLRLQPGGHLLDVFYRLHSTEESFFVPLDLELSNQELSYIVKRAEQWRGINSERKKVAVYDYVWKDELTTKMSHGCRPQKHNQTPGLEPSRGDITTHVTIYITHLNGRQELYRHFLRLPDGAIVEVFGSENNASFMQKPTSELDTGKQCSSSPDLQERQNKLFNATRS
ncbi:uncharacterized protein ofcc1 isoform X2 [Narcine bancroftii]|uniref:uncharacterized protein ofcc1 isoform X2 n=1 Tax=Narcine bancroftii TaxID=1343680 RepID=UPI0038316260